MSEQILDSIERTIRDRALACADTPVLLMVSGGSDSTALAYIASELHGRGVLGPCAIVHVNHKLRGAAADADARFVSHLADALEMSLFNCEVDVASHVQEEGANVEAVARRERYAAAHEALMSMCRHEGLPFAEGRIFTAHTADDRIENFYMRSIVGTGPGGFRSMLYLNGKIARPCLDCSRDDLRRYVRARAETNAVAVRDEQGDLWREDATNAHTDRFRAFVRHEIVPRAKERNPQLIQTLSRTMNLIADEDDMLNEQVDELVENCVIWLDADEPSGVDYASGCVLDPALGCQPRPMQRRTVMRVLANMLGEESRVETASIQAVLAAFPDSCADGETTLVNSGYVANIQGNLAVSANKRGVRIEPMAAFRARRKRS